MNKAQAQTGKNKHDGVLGRLLAMTGALAALYLLAGLFLETACWALFFVVATTAWPIWQYQREVTLFQRRLLLSGATEKDSWVRRWFWSGRISQVIQVFLSLVWATLLLALSTRLSPEHWIILAADVLVLSLLVGPIGRRLASQVPNQQLGVVARRWPLYSLNLIVLATAFLAVDFFIVGSQDTRGMLWHRVAETAFLEAGASAACAPAGWITGALAAVEQLGWHASQLAIPSIPEPALRLSVWSVILLQAGLTAYLLTRLQLGVLAWLDGRKQRRNGGPAEGAFSLAFIYTILVLALPYLYLSLKFNDLDLSALKQKSGEVIEWTNPCKFDNADAELLGALTERLEQARSEAHWHAEAGVNAALDELFVDVEHAVEGYLDWYFTVIGEYQRLAASIGGDFGSLMREKLHRHLFEDTQFADRLDTASRSIEAASGLRMRGAAEQLGQRTTAAITTEPCLRESVDLNAVGNLERDRIRAAVAAGSGAAAGAVSAKLLAQKAGATLVGKVAAKKGFQAAAAVAGKVAGKKGGSIILSATAATALCSPGGPLAVVCGVVAGAVTWLTVDKVMVEVDEALFRDEMRAELLQSLNESRLALAAELTTRQNALIDRTALQIQDAVERVFVPARDSFR